MSHYARCNHAENFGKLVGVREILMFSMLINLLLLRLVLLLFLILLKTQDVTVTTAVFIHPIHSTAKMDPSDTETCRPTCGRSDYQGVHGAVQCD